VRKKKDSGAWWNWFSLLSCYAALGRRCAGSGFAFLLAALASTLSKCLYSCLSLNRLLTSPFSHLTRSFLASLVTRLQPGRKFCTLKRLSSEMGWKYESVVSTLEAKRKVKSAEFYAAKKSKARAEKKAEEAAGEGMEVVKSTLRGLGY